MAVFANKIHSSVIGGLSCLRLILASLVLLISLYFSETIAQSNYTYTLDNTTRFNSITVKDGLSSDNTTCIHQDKYGFIWIGTSSGLNFYDGYSIKVFNSDPKDQNSLFNNYITQILEENDGTMWFSTKKGISKFNRANHTFSNYLPDSIDITNPNNSVHQILFSEDYLWLHVTNNLLRFNKISGTFESFGLNIREPNWSYSDFIFIDNSGTLWACSIDKNGEYILSKFNDETETFIHFKYDPADPESFPGFLIHSMMEDRDGTLWFAMKGGLLEMTDKKNGKFRNHFEKDTELKTYFYNNLSVVYEGNQGGIWVGGWTGFARFNKAKEKFTFYPIPNRTWIGNPKNVIKGIAEGVNGVFWLGSAQGFFFFDKQNGHLQHFIGGPDESSLLTDNLSNPIIDQSGQIWVATQSGISILNSFSNVFRSYNLKDHVKNESSGFLNKIILYEIYGDNKGNLWLGYGAGNRGGGLHVTTMNNTKVFEHFKRYRHVFDDHKTINTGNIYSIYEDQEQTLWFGGWGGLNKYNEVTESFTRYKHDYSNEASISGFSVESIYEDRYGTFWVGTGNGLNILDRANGNFIRLLHDDNDSRSISSKSIMVIYEDSQGELWFGGDHLDRLNRNDTSFIHNISSGFKSDVSFTQINDIIEDDSANLWIATGSNGLIKVDRLRKNYEAITTKDGLASNSISGIIFDDNGDLWVGSNKGLSRVVPSTYEITNYDITDGLSNMEISERSFHKDEDGWLYFGIRGGFNCFHPDSLKENKHIPPVYLTSIKIAGKQKYFDHPLFEMNEVELPHFDNDISFDFVALDYINPEKNQYAYMLEGYDEDWNYVGNRRSAYYTNLNPGTYTFRVKGSNNDGYWNEEGASLIVVIHPPFWKTWWAYSIYIISVIFIFVILRRNELRKIQLRQQAEINNAKAENLALLDAEKNKFFSNVSHEFRTPLTLILGPLGKAIDKIKDGEVKTNLDLVRRNALRLQTLINQLLSLSKLESGNLRLKARPENVVKLTGVLLESFHSLAEDRGIRIEFESDAEEYTVYLDKLKFEKIVNNLLSNAFKFTEKGGKIKVSVSSDISEEGRGVKLKFADTGIGIRKERLQHIFDRFYQVDEQQKKSDLGTGIGLALTKELVELHHGEIRVDSEFGMGTTFIISLPSGKEHLSNDQVVESPGPDGEIDEEMLLSGPVFVPDAVTKTVASDTEINEDSQLPLLLIVEDNADMRAYIKSYLVDAYQVLEASNGKEGSEMAINHLPDLIISDLMMPIMDGNEMTRQLKNDERTSHIPIILLTAKASTATKMEGLETGADDFLTKPFDAAELLVRVKNLIEQRQRLRKLLSQHIGDAGQTHVIKESFGKAMSKLDEQFLEKIKKRVEEQMSDPQFSVDKLAKDMAMSRSQLHRKLKGLTGITASDFIRDIRLVKAAELLKEGELNITQVTYEIGISSLSYFSKAFKEKYGVTPSEFV